MSKNDKVVVTGLGHFHPKNLIDNSFFNQLDIGSDAQWVTERTGIKSRCSVLPPRDLLSLRRHEVTLKQLRSEGKVMSIAQMSKKAWETLEKRTPNGLRDLDALSCGTSVPDFDIPANACTVAAEIGADCFSFDINSACSSFVVNLHIARSMLLAGSAKKMAIFTPERYSLRLDYTDKASCVLFGDGCGAATIELGASSGFELVDTIVTSCPEKYELVQIPVDGYFFQNGKAVQKFAITRTISITHEILERNNLGITDINYFIGHQANLRMLAAAAKKLGLSDDQHLFNVDLYGNQGGAGAPSVLSMNWDRFTSGDLVVVSVVGSGLTWASALLRKIGSSAESVGSQT